jgi:hypothetical protein
MATVKSLYILAEIMPLITHISKGYTGNDCYASSPSVQACKQTI